MTVAAILRSISHLTTVAGDHGERIAFSINVEMDAAELTQFFSAVVADAATWTPGQGMTIHMETNHAEDRPE